MKVFIAYDMDGEDRHQLMDRLLMISDALHAAGVESYSTHMQREIEPSGETVRAAFAKIDESDAVLAFVQTDSISESMVLEIGHAFGRKPIHIMTKRGIRLASYELADSVTEWDSVEEAIRLIKDRFELVEQVSEV